MSAQPHDWASHLDHVPVLDDPQFLIRRRPRISFYFWQRHRTAARNAWSTLDTVQRGTGPHTALTPLPAASAPRPTIRARVQGLPHRFAGHALVLGLVFAVIATRGLPGLALGMDWTQGATVATDHVAHTDELAAHYDETAPVVMSTASMAAPAANEMQDSLVPSLLPRQVVAGSAFVATHTVAAGEKLGQIAQQYNVSVLALLGANKIDPKLLAIGQELRIPRVSGLPHTVAAGETVETIATQYSVAPSTIRFFPPNNLSSGRSLLAGEEVFVPGATAIANGSTEAEAAEVTAVPVGTVIDNQTRMRVGPSTEYEKVAALDGNAQVALVGRHDNWFQVRTPNGTEGWISADLLAVGDGVADQVAVVVDVPPLPVAAAPAAEPAPAPAPVEKPAPAPAPKPAPVVSVRWVWPTSGDLTSGFGYRNFKVGQYHNGIDIANRKGTPIRAARAGKVIAAGWCSGYGYCVKINHGSGLVTEYGHLATRPNVGVGQYVNAGDRIGSMGSTYDRKGGGYSTGVHLHFTVKLNGKAVNPMRYLP